MAKGISFNTGVDTTRFDQMLDRLADILDKTQEINAKTIKPKTDDSDIRKLRKTLDDFYNEAYKSSRTNAELLNTKTAQKNISSLNSQLQDLAKDFDLSKLSSESISGFERNFLKAFANLKQYSDKYGLEISSDLQNIFSSIFSNADPFKQDYLKELYQKYTSDAESNFKKASYSISAEANENYARKLYNQYKEEQQLARETAETVKQAEREKKEALRNTRDEMVDEFKSLFASMKSSIGEEEMLDVDLSTWAKFQQQAYDLVQTLSEMGVETKELEGFLEQLGQKVYIPIDQINASRDSIKESETEVQKLRDEVELLKRLLADSSDVNEIDKLSTELSDVKQKLELVTAESERYRDLWLSSYTQGEFNELAAECYEYKNSLEKANEELEKLRKEFEIVKTERDNLYSSSSNQNVYGTTVSEVDKLGSETERVTQETSEYGVVARDSFDTGKLEGYVNVLEEIRGLLEKISTTLGTVDQSDGFTNIISNVNTLIGKLDEMYQKIGTGVNNITINQGINKEAQENKVAAEDYIKYTKNRYTKAYSNVVSAAGSEEKLFSYINNVADFKGGIDELYNLFSSSAVTNIESVESQVYRLMDFFKVLYQAMDSEYFQLDLSSINLPSSSDQTFRSTLKKKYGLNKSEDELLNTKTTEENLSEITQQLTQIKDLLSEISEKDLFGDSLNNFSIRLDEILEKFNTLVSDVNIVNDTPIETTDPGVEKQAKRTKEELIKATKAQKEYNEAIKEGQDSLSTQSTTITTSEVNTSAEKSTSAIEGEVKASVEATNAFESASQAKEDFKKSNEGVENSAKQSASAIKDEAKAIKNIDASKASNELEKADAKAQKTASDLEILNNKIAKQQEVLNGISLSTNKDYTADLNDRITNAIGKIEELREKLGNVTTAQGLKEWMSEFGVVSQQIKNINSDIREQESALKKVNNATKKNEREQEKLAEQTRRNSTNQTKMLSDFSLWVGKNRAAYKAYRDEIEAVYSKLGSTATLDKQQLSDVAKQINEIKTKAAQAGNVGNTVLGTIANRFKSLVAYLSTFASFYRIVSYIREAFTTIKDLDTQLVDLRKTTTMTTSELNEFYTASSDVGKQLGVTTSEIISQAAAWSRLGYSSKEAATQMAELSSQFASISPGVDTENATDYLVSTMKAFKVETDDVERSIMDNVNAIGNTFATTNGEIGEMLERSSAAMKAANNTLEETIALEAAAVEVTRNAETTGTAFRTISMRIRGYDEETEELSDDLKTISGDIYDLTKVNGKGISIFTDKNKTEYKSTYEILKEISEVWDDLTDKQQANLLEKLGGKRGAQSIAAILDDFSSVDKAMDTMENAAGSADREMGIIRDSLEYKINALKQTWVGTLQDVADRGDIGKLIDGLTSFSEAMGTVISNIGVFKTAFIGLGTVIGSQKLGLFNYDRVNKFTIGGSSLSGLLTNQNEKIFQQDASQSFISQLSKETDNVAFWDSKLATPKAVNDLASSIDGLDQSFVNCMVDAKANGLTIEEATSNFVQQGAVVTKLQGVFTKFGDIAGSAIATLGNALVSMGISVAASLIIQGIQDLINSYDDLVAKVSEITKSYTDAQSTLDDYTSKVVNIRTKLADESTTTEEAAEMTAELYNIQNDLIGTYGAYAAGLDLVNGKLEDQVGILQEINKQNLQKWENEVNAEKSSASKGLNLGANVLSWTNPLTSGLSAITKGRSATEDFINGKSFKDVINDYFFGEDLTGNELGDVLGTSLEQISRRWENFSDTINATDNEKINSIIDSFEEFEVVDGKIKISGAVDDVNDAVARLQIQLSDLGYENNKLNTDLINTAKETQSIIDSSGDSYNTFVYDQIMHSEELMNTYVSLTEAYNNYKAAQESGDSEATQKELDSYLEIMGTIENSNIDEKYKNYFKNMHEDLQSEITSWELEFNIVPKIKNTDLADYIGGNSYEEIYSDYIKWGQEDIDLPDGIENYFEQLSEYADETGISIMQLISLLQQLDDFDYSKAEAKLQQASHGYIQGIDDRLEELQEGGTVNLKLRPEIDSQDLEDAGWEDVGDGIATVFSSTFSNEDETKFINFTPIIVDPKTGEYKGVLSPDELTEYAEEVIAGTRTDDLNLQIGAEFDTEEAAVEAAEEIHSLHERISEGEDRSSSRLSSELYEATKKYYEAVNQYEKVGADKNTFSSGNVEIGQSYDFDTDTFVGEGYEIVYTPYVYNPDTGEKEALTPQEINDYINNIIEGATDQETGEIDFAMVMELDQKGVWNDSTGHVMQNLFMQSGTLDSGAIDSYQQEAKAINDRIVAFRDLYNAANDANMTVEEVKSAFNNGLNWDDEQIANFLGGLDEDELQAFLTLDLDDVSKVQTEEELKQLIDDAQEYADNNPIKMSVESTVKAMDTMEDIIGSDDLASVYETSVTKGERVNASDIQTINDNFGGITDDSGQRTALADELEAWNTALIENVGNTALAEETLNDLITAQIDETDYINTLTKENKDYAISELEAVGVTNAEEVVTTRLTKRAKSLTQGLRKLNDAWEDNADALEEYLDTGDSSNIENWDSSIESLTSALNDMFSYTADDGSIISPNFDADYVTNNLETIKNALNDDADALNTLSYEAGRQIIVGLELDESSKNDLVSEYNDLIDWLDSGSFTIDGDGYFNDDQIIQSFVDMMNQANLTASQIKAVLDNAGIESEVKYATKEVHVTTYGGKDAGKTDTTQTISYVESIKYKWVGNSTGTGAKYGGSNSSSSDSGSSGGGSDSDDENEDVFDWVEVAIDRLESELSRLDEIVDDVYEGWTKRNEALRDEITKTTNEVELQKQAAQRYLAEAESIDISDAYKKKVQQGELNIETITDEDLAEDIQDYQTYWENYQDAMDKVQTLTIELQGYYKEIFDNIEKEYEELVTKIGKQTDIIDERITRTEEHGYFVDKKYYENLQKLEKENNETLLKERENLINAMNNAITEGRIVNGSEAWHEMYQSIQDVNKALEESYTNMVKLDNELRQLKWDAFDWIEERISDIPAEADFLIGLLQGELNYEDNGQFNNRGFAQAALVGAKYDETLAKAQRYKDEILKINEEIAKDPNDKNLIERKEELVQAYRDAISAAEEEKQAMKSLVEEAFNKHLESLQELIDKYKEALSAEKDLYDYQKNIANQTKTISDLEKQLASIQNDDSEEARKRRQELTNQLESAQQQLEETEWDRYISETGDMLDTLYSDYEEYLNGKLDYVTVLMNDMINYLNLNGSNIQVGLGEIKDEYGLTTLYFEDFGNTANDILSTFNNGDFANKLTNISTIIQGFQDTMTKVTETSTNGVIKAIEAKSINIVINGDGTVSTSNSTGKASGGSGSSGGKTSTKTTNNNSSSNSGSTGKNGWVQSGGQWFYYKNGEMQANKWILDSDGWYYYVDPFGVMKTDEFVEGYWVGSDGKMRPDYFSWHQSSNGKWWYGTEDGSKYATDKVYIDGKWYTFDDKGWWKGYAKGTRRVSNSQLAWTQENSSELIYRSSDGAMLTPLNRGDMVFTNEMSQRLWEMASGNMLPEVNFNPQIEGVTQQSITSNNNISISLPNVENYQDFKREMQNDKELEQFFQEITIGQVMGNNKLRKNRF